MQENSPLSLAYLKSHYVSATRGNCDIYVAFVERALSLLRAGGSLGYILPHKFFNAQYGAPLRGHLSAGQHLRHIVHFGEHQVFTGATTYTCLLFLENARTPACDFVRVADLAEWEKSCAGTRGSIPAEQIAADEWNFSVGKNAVLVARLARLELKLAEVADIFVGLQTSADDVYVLETVSESARAIRLKSAALDAIVTLESALLYPLVSGTDVKAYAPLGNRQRILFPYVVNDERAALLDWKILGARYPRVADYLTANKPRLAAREGGKFKGPEWYRFGRSQNLGIQQRRKLCVPRLVSPLHATLDNEGTHFLDNVDVGGVTIQPAFVERLSLEALLALLNSTLLRWYFPFVSAPFRGGWMSANRQFLGQLPIALPDRTLHDQLVALANQMLAAKKQETASQSEADRDYFARKCADLAAKIDALVYQLYGLSPAEIDLVEGRA